MKTYGAFSLSPFEIENFCHVSTEQQQTLKVINSCSRFAHPRDFITSLHSLVSWFITIHHHLDVEIALFLIQLLESRKKRQKSMTAVKIMKSDGKFIDRPGVSITLIFAIITMQYSSSTFDVFCNLSLWLAKAS